MSQDRSDIFGIIKASCAHQSRQQSIHIMVVCFGTTQLSSQRPKCFRFDCSLSIRPVVEWLMGLPTGWVTNSDELTQNQQITALGNGVLPLQAVSALSLLPA